MKENYGQERAPWVVLARGIDFIDNEEGLFGLIKVPHNNGKTYELLVLGPVDLESEEALIWHIHRIINEE